MFGFFGVTCRGGMRLQVLEVGDCLFEAFAERDLWLPIEFLLGQANVGTTSLRIVLGEVSVDQRGLGSGKGDDFFGEFEDGEFGGITEIHGSFEGFVFHVAGHSFDEVACETEASGLLSLAVDRDGFIRKGLENKV